MSTTHPELKTFTQTVTEARKTLFQVAQNPSPSNTLPPGKRTLLHAFLKAKQDISTQQVMARQTDSGPDHEAATRPVEHVEGGPHVD